MKVPRLSLCCMVMTGALLIAVALRVPPVAVAEPEMPLGGVFVVDSTDDGNTFDNVLTLHEALLLARDGTGSNGLNRTLSSAEAGQLSGCAISGGLITGGCGPNQPDLIRFDTALGSGIVITLGVALPTINDTKATVLDGQNVFPTLNAAAVPRSGLVIASDHNEVSHLGVKNAPRHNFAITGTNATTNTLSDVWSWNAGENGVNIFASSGNQIELSRVGVLLAGSVLCNTPLGNKGNGGSGINIEGGAHDNSIFTTHIGCNGQDGVSVSGSHDNVIEGDWIGIDVLGRRSLGNNGNGISLGGNKNLVFQSAIGFNGSGVSISGASNQIIGNQILSNTVDGLVLSGATAQKNRLSFPPESPNVIMFNAGNGISLTNGATLNLISVSDVAYNGANGVALSGNNTGFNEIFLTRIMSNTLDGINERNGADINIWSTLSIFNNGGLGIDKFAPNDTANVVTPPFPRITAASTNGVSVTVQGVAGPVPVLGSVKVEVYGVAPDPSGFGEGATFLGSAITDASGNWTVAYTGTTVSCYTAFQTTSSGAIDESSSEFGPNSCRTLLPLVVR